MCVEDGSACCMCVEGSTGEVLWDQVASGGGAVVGGSKCHARRFYRASLPASALGGPSRGLRLPLLTGEARFMTGSGFGVPALICA